MTAALMWYVDDMKNYVSYIKHCTHKLEPDELNELWNGVGSSHPIIRWADELIPERWLREMDEPSKYHDVAYYLGGTEAHRKIADLLFRNMCLTRVRHRYSGLERKKGELVMYIAYCVLRAGGGCSFEYRDEPLTLEQLKELANSK